MQRSPNYPALELGDALIAVRSLYKTEGRTRVGAEIAAKAIGYRGLSGPARTKLSALKKFGLLDEEGGRMAVSESALKILLGDDGNPEFEAAVREAALTPALFKELYSTHREASVAAIKQHLVITKKFTDDGARLAAHVFKRTISFAKLDATEYSPSDVEIQVPVASAVATGGVGRVAIGEAPVREDRYLIMAGAAQVALTFSSRGGLKASTVGRLIKHLQLMHEDLLEQENQRAESAASTPDEKAPT